MLLPMSRPWLLLAAVFAFSVVCRPSIAQQPGARVELELYQSGRPSAQATQAWYQALTKLGVKNLKIRTAKPGDQQGIVTGGAPPNETYRVVGELNDRGEVVVPGGRFKVGDMPALSTWMGKLGDHGAAALTETKSAFGLNEQQLVAVHTDLSTPVEFATKGMKPMDVLRKLARGKHPLVIDPDLEKALTADDPMRDELQGFTRGMTLAVLLRPVGGVLVPRKPARSDVELAILDGKTNAELWPIGWATQEDTSKLAPKLLETLSAEIDGVTAAEALDAIQQRVEVPFLWDHNSLAMKKVKLDTPVSLPAGKRLYSKLLVEILGKIRCHYEIRVDENGKPFLWISA
jgi:hypothetical protein